MMEGRIWRRCLIVCVIVCGLGLGMGLGSVSSAADRRDDGLGDGLGGDLLPTILASTVKHNSHDERVGKDFGSDMCPECKPLPTTTPKTSSSPNPNFDMEERYGTDMCPECRIPAAAVAAAADLEAGVPHQYLCADRSADSHDESELGADMCPEFRQPMLRDPTVQMAIAQNAEDLVSYGADMCPECRMPLPGGEPLPHESPQKAKTFLNQKDLQQQRVAGAEKNSYASSPPTDFNRMVLELQKVASLQQAQLDQLAVLLQQLGRPSHAGMGARAAEGRKGKEQQQTFLGIEEQISTRDSSIPEPILTSRALQDGVPSTSDFEATADKLELNVPNTDEDAAAAPSKFSEAIISHQQQQQRQFNRGGSSSSSGSGGGSGGRGMTVARYKPAWSEHFSFLSAVKVDGEVSCLHLLPQEGEEGTSRYFVVGDTTGRLYIFLWLGDLLLDYRTISQSPITAMLSYALQKNETILVTGHSDGTVVVHQVWEKEERGSISDDGRVTLVSIETLHSLLPPAARGPSPASGTLPSDLEAGKIEKSAQEGTMKGTVQAGVRPKGRAGERKSNDNQKSNAVTNLEMYKVGKMRYTLVGHASGEIQLYKDNGSLHGVVQSPSKPLAFMRIPSAQRFIFLTDVGVGLLDFRSMQVRRYPCEGLNGSTMTAYSFDVVGRSKAHGFTSDGDLVSVALSGDMLHFECHVKRKRNLQITGPFVPQALKGYLITATQDRIFVFNTTLPSGLNYASFRVAGPTLLFSATMDEVALSFLPKSGLVKQSLWPLLASNRDRLVVVGFGDGYVGVFRSNLPTTKPADFSVKFWNSSVLVSALAILVAWQLISKKRDITAGPGTGGSDHSLMAGSGDLMAFDKDSPRLAFDQARDGSEPTYRSRTRGYVDSSKSAPFGSDSRRYRPSSAVDTGIGYSARREPLFASTQPVGELELRQ